MRYESYNTYLAHHGITGQKWGVQNGPSYPLSNSQRSVAERNNNPQPTDSGDTQSKRYIEATVHAQDEWKKAKKTNTTSSIGASAVASAVAIIGGLTPASPVTTALAAAGIISFRVASSALLGKKYNSIANTLEEDLTYLDDTYNAKGNSYAYIDKKYKSSRVTSKHQKS